MTQYNRHSKGGKLDADGFFQPYNFSKSLDDMKIVLSRSYHKRPDKVAFDVYGRQDLSWFVLQYNNIIDVSEFIETLEITLPNPKRLFSGMI